VRAPELDHLLSRHKNDRHVAAARAPVASFRADAVVYVQVEAGDVVRIISARKTTPHERKAYENK
jgi:uncharacterized DUF497 family protein